MRFDDFCHAHFDVNQYQNYCEAVILPNGEIEYAVPAHVFYLEALYLKCEPIQIQINPRLQYQLQTEMPIEASPLHWLVDKLGVVSVWYNSLVCPMNITKAQIQTINQLIGVKAISSRLNVVVSVEAQFLEKRATQTKDLDNMLLLLHQQRDAVSKELQKQIRGQITMCL